MSLRKHLIAGVPLATLAAPSIALAQSPGQQTPTTGHGMTDRLDAHIQAMQGMLDSMKAMKPATEALYKVLADDQKKKADLLLGNGCCMM